MRSNSCLTISTTLFCLAISTSAWANSAELKDQLQTCSIIAASDARLQCFDALAQSLNPPSTQPAPTSVQQTQLTESPAPVASATVSSTTPASTESFGAEQVKVDKAEDKPKEESITATIVSTKRDAYKRYRITLDNGQVWKQRETVRFSLREGQEVIIRRGLVGNYYLTKSGGGKKISVNRVK
ncbi:hypothetical protein [Paraferrimonas sedimenticola]|uniref:Uncharacterized protein n=1 Tax=Paraferrimonas sedimenticola TaxID=375674 RepID=A0AA37RY82_9GAMM|nr:hypothetical protein [Paraferrimonas sedimenticola]GLP97440.1 hypothetical protein GCM10007895_27470 [Paraferrimonas sedimenticola]